MENSEMYGKTPPLTQEQRNLKANVSICQTDVVEHYRAIASGNCWLELVYEHGSVDPGQLNLCYREFGAGGKTTLKKIRVPLVCVTLPMDEKIQEYQPIESMNHETGIVLGRMES